MITKIMQNDLKVNITKFYLLCFAVVFFIPMEK